MSSFRSHPVAHVGRGDNTLAGVHPTRGRNLEYPERAYDRVERLAGRIPLRRADGAKNAEYEQGRLVLPAVQALLSYKGAGTINPQVLIICMSAGTGA